MTTFKARKLKRKDAHLKYVFKWKIRECTSCGGSGTHDNIGSPICANCNGTGKEKYKDESKAI